MCAPSIPLVMQEFHNSSELYGVWVLSVYVLGFAFGPLIAAPLSELYGRLVVYHIFNTFFLIFIVACAVSDSLGMLAGFRFLAGLAGSGPITLGAGSVGDFVVPHRRGIAIAVWSIGALMGPAVSPVIGGFLSQAKGWRWIYWLLAIVVNKLASMCDQS
jgi:multidrug resistance protein